MSEQPGQGRGETYSMKALNTTTGSYQRQKGGELPWLVLPQYRTLNEVSECRTEPRSPARTALKTSTAILCSTEKWIQNNTQNSNCSSQGKTNLSHWIRVSRCVCHPSTRPKEMVGPLCIWNRKSLKAKRNIISQKILMME